MEFDLTPGQHALADSPTASKIFLRGPAGCGKTSAGVERALHLLEPSTSLRPGLGLPAESVLILTPQRTLQSPYEQAILSAGYAGGQVTFATLGGLARRMCDLFWPLAAESAGFAQPDQPPVFLTLETAQYYMAHLVRPKLDEGMFDSVTIDRNRLYSQILDNLNKSALVGFDYREIGERLSAAWTGDPAQRRIYADAQTCATMFREYCLANNLLDFSLQLEIFTNILWNEPIVRDFLTRTYRHLIYDNVEEDFPRAHDLLREWLPEFDSALLIYDEGGGFRQFLGADPQTGEALRELCDEEVVFEGSFVMSEQVAALAEGLVEAIIPTPTPALPHFQSTEIGEGEKGNAYDFLLTRFYPELLDAVTAKISALINEEGIPPQEIVVLSPYLSDALRFSLMNRLQAANIPVRSHRPSRSLRDEPASQALLTLAELAHPDWNIHPTRFDVAYAFMLALGTDLVRAQLLTEIVYRQKDSRLSSFEEIKPETQERVTYTLGERYSIIRNWILAYRESDALPLDHFLRKLFGEVLSQPDFGFHRNPDAARVASSLIESVQKFRIALDLTGFENLLGLGKEYIAMLQDGVIAAAYVEAWRADEKETVFVAPAHTFLMTNRPARIQFWLDAGSNGWVERLFQPLTHPYVLARGWQPSRPWSDADEVQSQKAALARLVSGLLHRCGKRVTLGLSDLGESGFEQRGELLRAFQHVIQKTGQSL
jgi:hypothetical protein